jgi:hypothetical protein
MRCCSASQVVADAKDAVETAGSLLDLVEAADIADEVRRPSLLVQPSL